ncbi:F420 biosynthesis protein FbiB, C-terminal domain-containing protein [Pseudobutyrivibrio sp. YE44]|uniref:nitroreductase family protein n=1 Tax=Pseudobutyrivibrio sp. YE44 TaxID=1520802 RepID=UPI0008922DBB|nr:nitroreductase family protein [Pseudobutyrivibrio sp. YE44]SDB56558.1 F420 biosynthesis protein FbiB, C-terminal domain-containing protein [Pseudobutyrivibrio sp. YE44]
MDSITSRRSIRKYTSEPVSKDQIREMVEAAILSPSAKNRQPWKFLVYMNSQKDEILDVMETALENEKETHALLPESAGGLADAFNTLKIMREATALIMVLNTNGGSPFEDINPDDRITEICDTLSIGASIENLLLKATEMGLGTLWIANTCFAYKDLTDYIGEKGQLIGAISVGYAAENPNPRPRKKIEDVLTFVE